MVVYQRFVVFSGQTETLIPGTNYTNKIAYSGNGGAGEVQAGGTLIADSVSMKGNTASNGGAVINAGTAIISGSTFSGNVASLGGAIYNTGTVNFTGEVTLATNSDTIYSEGTLNWDLTGTTTGKLNGYNLLTNNGGTLQITVSAEQTSGSYILASGDFTDFANKDTFTITGIQGEADQTITIGSDKVFYGDSGYSLKVDQDKLLLEAWTLQSITYVNPAWSELSKGTTVVVSGGKTAVIGSDAFSNTTDAVKVTAKGGTISNEGSTPLMFTNGVSDIFTSGIIYNSGTSITLDNDLFASTVYCGEGNNSTIPSGKEISVKGTTITGGYLYSDKFTGVVQEGARANITMNVSDAAMKQNNRGVFGGGYVSGENTLLSNHNVTITDTSASLFVGGHNILTGGTAEIQGDYTLNLINCSGINAASSQMVIGGSMLGSNAHENREGNTIINISGGSVNTVIYGGSLVQGANRTETSHTEGNITINIGGDFHMTYGAAGSETSLYGAAGSIKLASTLDDKVTVKGNVAITVDYSDGASLGNFVFAGGYAYAKVDGNAVITLKGTSSEAISTNFKLDSRNGQYGTSFVTGDRELKFPNFKGEISGIIESANKITIDKDSAVELSSASLNFGGINWDISGTAGTTSLKIDEDFNASFAMSQFNLHCDDLTEENSWTVLDAKAGASLLEKGLESATVTFNGVEMAFYQDESICAFINEEYMLTVDEESGDLIASRLV